MKYSICLASALFLAGCADLFILSDKPDNAGIDKWRLRQLALAGLQSWILTGRVTILTEKDGWAATLYWVQDNENYTLRFIAPLGQGTYELSGNTNAVSLLTADNHLLQSDDPESLMQENLGWQVPLSGLKYWIRGLPEPDVTADDLSLDEKGRITNLQQGGWQIKFLRYAEVNGRELPEKLFMQNEHFQLRLVIKGWKTTV